MASWYARSRHKLEQNVNKELYNGYGLDSLDHNVRSLQDPTVPLENKLNCLKFLNNQLSDPQVKCRAVKFGIIASLNWLVAKNLGVDTDELACKAYRSLCLSPPTVFSVYRNQGVESLLAVLSRNTDNKDYLPAREAACDAITAMCASWDTKRLLLGDELPDGMHSIDVEPEDSACAFPSADVRRNLCRRVIEVLSGVISAYNTGGTVGSNSLLLKHSVHSLAQLTGELTGLEQCLIVGVLRDVDDLLRIFTKHPTLWGGGNSVECEVLQHVVSVVWNMCSDPLGKRKPETLDSIPFCLGRILLVVNSVSHKPYLRLKAATAGALSTIYVYEKAKTTAIQPLLQDADAAAFGLADGTYTDVADVCVALLRSSNDMYRKVKQGNAASIDKALTPDLVTELVTAIVKNTVQTLRLICELPAARTRVAVLIGNDPAVCLQLFKGTPVQNEMVEACGVSL